ncbi:MAG: hypothetical protein ACI9HA_003355 [Dinoroseobacter sp.]|jgi:hypothetical protein
MSPMGVFTQSGPDAAMSLALGRNWSDSELVVALAVIATLGYLTIQLYSSYSRLCSQLRQH